MEAVVDLRDSRIASRVSVFYLGTQKIAVLTPWESWKIERLKEMKVICIWVK